jgi:ABC-type uncharacterized transport system substrate-binding protein
MKLVSIILFLFLSIPCSAVDAKNILVIFSYLPSSWNSNGMLGIKNAFSKSAIEVNLIEYVYDNINVRQESKQKAKIAELKRIIKEKNIHGVIIFDDEAADDLYTSISKLGLPISITGVNKEKSEINWIDNSLKSAIVYERYPFEKSLELLKRIDKNVEEITILTSANESSKRIVSQITNKFKQNKDQYAGIKLKKTIISSEWNDWKEIIKKSQSKKDSFWVLVPWDVNENGKEIDLRKMGQYFQENSKIPIIGIVDINVQMGFLASFSVHSEDLGYQAANNLIKLFNDGKAQLIEETVKKVRFVINRERMNTLGLKVPLEILDMATIQDRVELKTKR